MSAEDVQYRELPMGQIIIKHCGTEACSPGHRFGPAVRDHYLVHYIVAGKGTFTSEYGTYPLSAGQGFIIFPNQVTVYQADRQEPWTYGWVGYKGLDASMLTKQVGLSIETPVFDASPADEIFNILKTMENESSKLRMGHMSTLGGFYRLFPYIDQRSPNESYALSQQYFSKAQWYMEGNYNRPIRISDVAAFVGLSRSQLFRIFIASCGYSPKTMLTKLRMQKAKELVESHDLHIADIAASVGMSDGEQLVRRFKQHYGVTPNQLKKRRQKSRQDQAPARADEKQDKAGGG